MKKIILIIGLLSVLTACTTKETIYRAPDETRVQKQKTLVIPPNFELRPPLNEKG